MYVYFEYLQTTSFRKKNFDYALIQYIICKHKLLILTTIIWEE